MIRLVLLFFFINLTILGWPQDSVLYQEAFNYTDGSLPKDWWTEGNAAFVKNKHLYADANDKNYRCATVWLNRVFEGDLQIDYDVQFIASSDNANNNNFFFFYSSPDKDKIIKTRNQRIDGKYAKYHILNGYIFTHVLNNENKSRFRFRKCPGFHLLKEAFSKKSIFGQTYHITIIKINNHIQYKIDGKMIFDVNDLKNPMHSKGLIGFRTWHTELWWDNLIVKRIGAINTN